MPKRDSVDKIVTTYFAAVTAERFTYKKQVYRPLSLVVSPLLFRGYTCPSECGGCCVRFSLDYIPGEKRPQGTYERRVEFDGRKVLVYTDAQDEDKAYYCRHLDTDNGRCGIHGIHPFSCDFELTRFITSAEGSRLSTQLYGRGWNMSRVDGGKGARCEMLPPDEEWQSDVVRKLRRLKEWTNHFGLRTRLDEVIDWVGRGPHSSPLVIKGERTPQVPLPVINPFEE